MLRAKDRSAKGSTFKEDDSVLPSIGCITLGCVRVRVQVPPCLGLPDPLHGVPLPGPPGQPPGTVAVQIFFLRISQNFS